MPGNLSERFQDFIKGKNLFADDCRLLVAVSGGVDSVVLCHLISQLKNSFALAHCNFHLRGKESVLDAAFVVKLAGKMGVDAHVHNFEQEEVTGMPGHSIQMAARELRYGWFASLLEEHHYDFISTAHHLDDQAETMLLNLAKGTGIRGLHGILPLHPPLVRPLLFATKDEIMAYAEENDIEYRHDASNEDVKYQRNLLRHQVIPVLRKINPSLDHGLGETAARMQFAEHVFNTALHHLQDEIFKEQEDGFVISLQALRLLPHLRHFLFEWLQPFGFTAGMAEEALELLDSQPGRKIASPTHELIRDRSALLLHPLKEKHSSQAEAIITKETREFVFNGQIFKTSIVSVDKIKDLKNPEEAYLNLKKLQFPLVVRHWQPGDSFKPFGMKVRKKLSDFLTDEKVPVARKPEITVVTSEAKIAWIAGMRIDNSFAINPYSKKAFRIKLTR